MSTKLLIKSTFETLDAEGEVVERGFENEEGVAFDNILEAASYLQDQGACHPSASFPHENIWFTTGEDQNFRTGESTTRSYHPKGFSDTQLKTLFAVATARQNFIGHPMCLDFCYVDDYEASRKEMTIDANHIVQASEVTSLVGKHEFEAYMREFATDKHQTDEKLNAMLEVEAGGRLDDLVPGTVAFEMKHDKVYFDLMATPIVIVTKTEYGDAYQTVSKEGLVEFAKANKPVISAR